MDSRRRILLAALFQILKYIDSTNIALDADECLVNNGGCQHICNNTNGSYTCSCDDGFLLETDLHNCTKNECLVNNGGCQHICNNTNGSYTCSCDDGFLLETDLHNCTKNECLVNNGGCQHICNNTNGSYTCSCDEGFLLETDLHNCTKSKCGEDLEGTIGVIMSPQFPFYYTPNAKCIWKITVPPQQTIFLNFTAFDVEGNHEECAYDSVEVFSLIGKSVVKHGAFCGSRLPPLITSYGNSMMIKFTSNGRLQDSGFAVFFYADKDECSGNNGGCQHFCNNTIGSYTCSCEDGFVLDADQHNCTEGCNYNITSPYGVIRSPFYPDFYPNSSDCSWLFTAKPGHRIKLDFKDFKLEPHQECEYDFIEAFDGDNNESPTLGKFCGSNVSNPILASGNRMYLVFKSNLYIEREGFKAIHTTVCGGRLFALRNKEYLFSHAKYDEEDYPIDTDCDWIIQAAENQRIKFHFLTFEMEYGDECESDYVEVYDGEDDSAKSLGKFCGNEYVCGSHESSDTFGIAYGKDGDSTPRIEQVPPEIYSSGDSLMVRFRSDATITREGFSATYVSVPFIDHVDVLETD